MKNHLLLLRKNTPKNTKIQPGFFLSLHMWGSFSSWTTCTKSEVLHCSQIWSTRPEVLWSSGKNTSTSLVSMVSDIRIDIRVRCEVPTSPNCMKWFHHLTFGTSLFDVGERGQYLLEQKRVWCLRVTLQMIGMSEWKSNFEKKVHNINHIYMAVTLGPIAMSLRLVPWIWF